MQDTRNRVPANTDAEINKKIRDETDARVRYYQQHKNDIRSRLRQLDEEWDIERAIECNASALAFTGVVLGATGDKRWLLLPAMVTAFLFQHAIQGWCPPVPILRRMGFRTASEIEQERQALKALRGDFAGISNDNADAILSAVRACRIDIRGRQRGSIWQRFAPRRSCRKVEKAPIFTQVWVSSGGFPVKKADLARAFTIPASRLG